MSAISKVQREWPSDLHSARCNEGCVRIVNVEADSQGVSLDGVSCAAQPQRWSTGLLIV